MSVDYLNAYLAAVEDAPLDIQHHVSAIRQVDVDVGNSMSSVRRLIEQMRKDEAGASSKLELLKQLKEALESQVAPGMQRKMENAKAIFDRVSDEAQVLDQKQQEYKNGTYKKAVRERAANQELKRRRVEAAKGHSDARGAERPASAASSATSRKDGGSTKTERRAKSERQRSKSRAKKAQEQEPEPQGNEQEDEERYCVPECAVTGGDMVACDNDNCKGQWFHYVCVGLKAAPTTAKWYCPACRPLFQGKKR